MRIPFTITKNSVTVVLDDKSHIVNKDHINYGKLLAALRFSQWEDIPGLVNPGAIVEKLSSGAFRVVDERVIVSLPYGGEFVCPTELSEHIIMFMSEGLDFNPLVNFARKLSQNPSQRSVEQLFKWIRKSKFTIHDDGDFIGYKGVRPDMKDHHTGNFDNSVGKILEMPREEVNADPNNGCSHGFHVATYDYAHHHYGSGNRVTIFVKVNPMDVVAVPNGEIEKMRVCKYEILGISKAAIDDRVFTPEPAGPEDDDYEDEDEDEDEEYEEDY